MSDLREHLEALREEWHAQVEDSRLDDLAAASIASRARRSRNGRTALAWASGTAAVTLVAVAIWAGMGAAADVAPPAQSVSASPTAPTTEPTPVAVSGELPTMPPATEEVWASVDDDWTLVTLSGAQTPDNSTPLYLVDPAGKAYALPSVDPEMTVWKWVPGERQAWFTQCCDQSWVLVDLTTGETLPTPDWLADSGLQPVSVLPDGRVMGYDSTGTGNYIVGPEGVVEIPDIDGPLSPDGAYLASSSGVIDTRTGEPIALTGYDDDDRCSPMGWYNATTIALACGARDEAGLVYTDGSVRLVDVLTGEVRDGHWPEQPGIPAADTWATTAYTAWSDGSVLVGVGGDPRAGQDNLSTQNAPAGPSRSQPRLLTRDGVLQPLAVPGLAPECAMLIAPRPEHRVVAIRDWCAEEPSIAGLFQVVDGELVPAVPLDELLGDVTGVGISGWAE